MSLLFSALFYALLFWIFSNQFPADSSSIDNYSITQFFDQYAAYAGAAIALLSLLGMFLAKGILALFKASKARATNGLLIFLGFAPWAVFGYQLVYREPRYANIAKAIIEYLGEPMFYSSLALVLLGLIMLIASLLKKPVS